MESNDNQGWWSAKEESSLRLNSNPSLAKRTNYLNKKYYSLFKQSAHLVNITVKTASEMTISNETIRKLFESANITSFDESYFLINQYPSSKAHYSPICPPAGYSSQSKVLSPIKWTRRALADGDSFFRSFIFRFIQQIICLSFSKLKQHIYLINKLLKNNHSFKGSDTNEELKRVLSVLNVLFTLIVKAQNTKEEEEKKKLTEEASVLFDKAFNNDSFFEMGLIRYMKVVLSDYIRTAAFFNLDKLLEHQLINPIYILSKDLFKAEEFIRDKIEQTPASSSMLIVMLTSMAFSVTIQLFIKEKESIMKKTFHFETDSQNSEKSSLLNIVYSQHRYSIAYLEGDLVESQIKSPMNYTFEWSKVKTSQCIEQESLLTKGDNIFISEDLVKAIEEALNKRIDYFNAIGNRQFECKKSLITFLIDYIRPITLVNGNGDELTVYDKDICDLNIFGFFKADSIRSQLLYQMRRKCLVCSSNVIKSNSSLLTVSSQYVYCSHCLDQFFDRAQYTRGVYEEAKAKNCFQCLKKLKRQEAKVSKLNNILNDGNHCQCHQCYNKALLNTWDKGVVEVFCMICKDYHSFSNDNL